MFFVGNFSYVLVIIVGAALALEGHITIGIIVAFMVYVRTFSQPLSQIAQGITSLQQASAAMTRVLEFLAEAEMQDESHKDRQLSNMKGEVVFDHVSFGYTPERTIIHDFSATAHAGQKVAIVGPTGAGKTTIVNLLMKFYEIDKGSIRIDGVDTKDMKRSEVHDAFSMVLQDTWLFEGTIRENLIYNQTGISDERMMEASKAVGIHHFIMTLPDGYDTILDDTVTLSVGQKQLLTIARALLKDAPLLILDEATSSVDTRTEELIQKAMDRLMEGRTSFVIAHRLSTIRNADLILVMKDGNIIEQGNHEELMAQGAQLIDIRSADEHARERIAEARHIPLDQFPSSGSLPVSASVVIFHCRSGQRTRMNASKLEASCGGSGAEVQTYILEGGLDAWKSAGLPVVRDASQPLELQRQVQIAAGAMIVLGFVLGISVSPWFHLLSGFVGAGLMFAGISGFCGLARLLVRMPWNRKAMTASTVCLHCPNIKESS